MMHLPKSENVKRNQLLLRYPFDRGFLHSFTPRSMGTEARHAMATRAVDLRSLCAQTQSAESLRGME